MRTAIKQDKLSFSNQKLTRERHRIHPYPAMLHPLLVDYLIQKYAKKNSVIFDPFCGSGVTLLQSSIHGYDSIGFDINPLALLIAKVKVQKYDIKLLLKEYYDLKKNILLNKKTDIPYIRNLDYWYSNDVCNDLGRIRAVLKENKYKYKDFFLISFAYVCRKQSFTRNGEFKRYRMEQSKLELSKNEVFKNFFNHIEKMIEVICNSPKSLASSFPLLANSENPIPEKISYDLVITSPPYGDSRTTVAYGEYSSFGSEWIGDINTYGNVDYKVDKESIGKVGEINKDLKKYELLTKLINKIEKKDVKRSKDVLYFFNGYYNVIKNVIKNLKSQGRVCFVVGNRTVKGYQIPMDQITVSFFEGLGLKFESVLVRDISNKVMPLKNSPTNKVGEKKQTMINEYIVTFQKG